MTPQTYTFHVHGMHCKACVVLTESELTELPQIVSAKANLHRRSMTVTGNFDSSEPQTIAERLSAKLRPHGYSLSLEKQIQAVNWSEFKFALPIAAILVLLFITLQKFGLVNLIGSDKVTYPTAALIGVIASLSTCMAVVGGLVLSMSANFAKEGDKIKPQLLFHLGRLAAFFVLGGVIGAIGAMFRLGISGTVVLSIIIGIVMVLLGINLLDIFPWAKKLQPTMPKFLSNHLLRAKKINHTLTPVLLGVVTFFLPCGFTQSMQIYTLGTGNFLSGGLTMLAFALGTLPVLALLSFSSAGISQRKTSGIFFKTAGLVVIFFGVLNLTIAATVAGIIPPLLNL